MRWNAWKTKPTKPTERRRSLASARSPRSCSGVDVPQPLGPVTASVCPAGTSRSTWSTAHSRLSSCPYARDSPTVRSTADASPARRPSVFTSLLPPFPRGARADQVRAHASSHRRSACNRRAMPSRSSPASEFVSCARAACWVSARLRISSRRRASTSVSGSARPDSAAATSFGSFQCCSGGLSGSGRPACPAQLMRRARKKSSLSSRRDRSRPVSCSMRPTR